MYVETMTATLTELLLRSVTLQTNARMTDIAIGQLNERILELEEKEKEIEALKNEISLLTLVKREYEGAKQSLDHVDTFRSQLATARQEKDDAVRRYEDQISKLNEQIAYLQLSPAKRKKIDELNNATNTGITEAIEDGGEF
jgi:predicted nuclease with TOPRIM domain